MSSLPERPNLGHLRKQAKELLRQYRAHNPAAMASFRQYLPAAAGKSDTELSTLALMLRDAQSCIARQYGFSSWHELKSHVEAPLVGGSDQGDGDAPGSTRAEITRYERAQRAYEQARPRVAVPFDPGNFDKYVGYYQLKHSPSLFTHIFRTGDRFFEQLNVERRIGIQPVEFFAEGEDKFFAKRVACQISFVMDAQGQVSGLVFHQNGLESPAIRVDKSAADRYEAALDQRIKDNAANPAIEAFLHRYITSCEKGQPNYEDMSPLLAKGVRRLQPRIQMRHRRVGSFKALCFKGIDHRGWEVFEATFAQGQIEYRIPPLTPDGKVKDIAPREVP